MIEETVDAISNNFFDIDERVRIIRSVSAELKLEAPWIVLPIPNVFNFWQPWVKGYHGETLPMFLGPARQASYVWIDQDLKYEMTGRR